MDAEAETKTKKKNKGWRSKLSNSFLKKNKRASSTTCTETRDDACPETREGIGHGGEQDEEDNKGKKSFIFQPRISALADPLEYGRRMGWLTKTQSTTRDDKNDQLDNNTDREAKTSTRSDADVSSRMRTNTPESRSNDSDDNKLTSKESRTEVVGEKKKTRYSDRISAFGRQMGWLSTSTGKSSDYNNSDTNTTNLLPVDESETQAKGEGAKADSLEYHEAYYSQLEKNERTSLRTQTATESISQKKCYVVRPSALEFGRKMGWVP